jgi:hypothetical protein
VIYSHLDPAVASQAQKLPPHVVDQLAEIMQCQRSSVSSYRKRILQKVRDWLAAGGASPQ